MINDHQFNFGFLTLILDFIIIIIIIIFPSD